MNRYVGMYAENVASTLPAPVRVVFELPVLRYPLSTPWHPNGGERYFAGFWLPYAASEADARQHVADFERTRIKPGADPRVEWERSCGVGRFETGTRALPRAVSIITASRTDGYRYVPEDVCRWRDPKHRAALTERAHAHAALVPGCRATMEVER